MHKVKTIACLPALHQQSKCFNRKTIKQKKKGPTPVSVLMQSRWLPLVYYLCHCINGTKLISIISLVRHFQIKKNKIVAVEYCGSKHPLEQQATLNCLRSILPVRPTDEM